MFWRAERGLLPVLANHAQGVALAAAAQLPRGDCDANFHHAAGIKITAAKARGAGSCVIW
jgi:hypothetical protein